MRLPRLDEGRGPRRPAPTRQPSRLHPGPRGARRTTRWWIWRRPASTRDGTRSSPLPRSRSRMRRVMVGGTRPPSCAPRGCPRRRRSASTACGRRIWPTPHAARGARPDARVADGTGARRPRRLGGAGLPRGGAQAGGASPRRAGARHVRPRSASPSRPRTSAMDRRCRSRMSYGHSAFPCTARTSPRVTR